MQRVWVVGDSGSGKTTLARAIADRLGAPHTELDALFHGPNWTPRPDFEDRVRAAIAGGSWVVDGNYYSQGGAVILDRADTVVWLDYPVRITWPRVVRRSFRRAIDQRELWNGNRERLGDWLHASHPIWWTLTHHRLVRRRYAAVADNRWRRFRHPEEAAVWLAEVGGG